MEKILFLATIVSTRVFIVEAVSATPSTINSCQADVHFLLDSSGSVGLTNYQKQLAFVKNFSDSFHIGADGVQIGVTTFSTTVYPQFYMNTYSNKSQLDAAIARIPYSAGNTRTGLGLRYVRRNAFTKEHGDREGVENILIFITDGQSSSPSATVAEANAIHLENITVITLGIGQGVDNNELTYIASDPNYVFYINSFDSLNRILSTFEKLICPSSASTTTTTVPTTLINVTSSTITFFNTSTSTSTLSGSLTTDKTTISDTTPISVTTSTSKIQNTTVSTISSTTVASSMSTLVSRTSTTTKATTTVSPTKFCKDDIHFLLDSSGSVGVTNYKKMLDFIKEFTKSFVISPNNVQIGITLFSTDVQHQFWMNNHTDKDSLLRAIDQIGYPIGSTYTSKGLDFVRQNAFTKAHGARDGVNNILIVITDGKSTDPVATVTAANELHKQAIKVIAVGVGSVHDSGFDQAELSRIASDPNDVFTVSNFDALNNINDILVKTTCSQNINRKGSSSFSCKFNKMLGNSKTANQSCGVLQKKKACEILRRNAFSGLTLAKEHKDLVTDNSVAFKNILDMCDGYQAKSSNNDCSRCRSGSRPGGSVCLDDCVLDYILKLSQDGPVVVNELAGGCHECSSPHYQGMAVEVAFSTKNSNHINECVKMGGTV